jgi:hypothetical protein
MGAALFFAAVQEISKDVLWGWVVSAVCLRVTGAAVSRPGGVAFGCSVLHFFHAGFAFFPF